MVLKLYIEALRCLRDQFRYHGMYEILDYEATLEILDLKGKKAVLTRREVIRFLQDNVVAIHDHAWGDGELFAEYRCQPGAPVDSYEDGSKWNVLISLICLGVPWALAPRRALVWASSC